MNYEKYSEVIIPPEANLKLPTNNNSRYFYNNKIKQLVLDIVFNTNSGNKPREFKLQLADPLMIDVEHDIFLDTVVTYNLKSSKLPQNMAFLLKIDQFNIQTKSATNIIKPGEPAVGDNTAAVNQVINNRINNSIMIPNEKSHETIHHFIAVSPSVLNQSGTGDTTDKIYIIDGQKIEDYYVDYIMILHKSDERSIICKITSSEWEEGQAGDLDKSLLSYDVVKFIDGEEDDATVNEWSAVPGASIEIFKEHNNHSTIHKGRKHNYVGTITPSKLAIITGSVSDMGSLNFTQSNIESNIDGNLSKINYSNPFHDAIPTIHNNNISINIFERMIVEFKLVPRQ